MYICILYNKYTFLQFMFIYLIIDGQVRLEHLVRLVRLIRLDRLQTDYLRVFLGQVMDKRKTSVCTESKRRTD